MSTLLASLVVVSLLITEAICQQTSCSSTEPLIDSNRFKVEDFQITASSTYSENYDTPDIRLSTSSTWCAEDGLGADSWIQVEFGADVIIHELRIGGDGGLSQFFLTEFLVEVGPSTAELSPILQTNSDQPMVFTRSGASLSTTQLPNPVVTRVLRVTTVNHQNDVPCVEMEALGCIQSPACDGNQLLSTNRSLLPLASITASSETDNLAAHVVDSSETGWCSTEAFNEADPSPYIIFNFTERVALTYMRARGGLGAPVIGVSAYVTDFALDYRDQYSDSYTPYIHLNEEEFSTEQSSLQTYTFWNQPLQGRTFRFKIADGERTFAIEDFCWNVQLYGCLAPEQDGTTTIVPPLTPTTSEQPSTATTPVVTMTPTVDTTEPMTTPTLGPGTNGTIATDTLPQSGAPIAAIVGGAVGVVVVLLVLCPLMVLVLVCIIAKSRRNKEARLSEVEYTQSGEVRIVDNELYGKDTPPTSPTGNMQRKPSGENTYESIKSRGTNPIDLDTYETIGTPNVKPASSLDSRTYEAIGTPPVYTYAAVDTPVRAVVPGDSNSRGGSLLISPEHNGHNQSVENVKGIERNTAYGSMEGVQMSPNHGHMEYVHMSPSPVRGEKDVNTPCGSLIDNEAYAEARHGFEASDRSEVNNPMYGEAQGLAEENKELINNPMYDTATM